MTRILQLTDLHLFADSAATLQGVNTDVSFARVWDRAVTTDPPPDLLLLTGDLAHDDSLAVYQRLAERSREQRWPVAWVPGNHDDPKRISQAFAPGIGEHLAPVLLGAWWVIPLNSQIPGQVEGRLGQDRCARLAGALRACEKAGLHVLIAIHHPPYDVQSAWIDAYGLEDASEFWQVVDQTSCVRAIVNGHVHQEWDAWRGPVRLLSSPSTAFQFAAGQDDFALDPCPPGFRVLDLHDDGSLTTEVVRVPARPT